MLMMLALGHGIQSHWCWKGWADADDAGFAPWHSQPLVLEGATDADDAGFGPWHSQPLVLKRGSLC